MSNYSNEIELFTHLITRDNHVEVIKEILMLDFDFENDAERLASEIDKECTTIYQKVEAAINYSDDKLGSFLIGNSDLCSDYKFTIHEIDGFTSLLSLAYSM